MASGNSRERGCRAILGMNPYMTNVELWEYKTGRRERDVKDSDYMKYGRETEWVLIGLFELDYPNEKAKQTPLHDRKK
ncbi:MAG: hypothetical protein LBT58_00990 [Endomicrobium sp.]|jgi:predicted phage-related endonuclease|nr:hypothetical protein [Endomicrobium sp.]